MNPIQTLHQQTMDFAEQADLAKLHGNNQRAPTLLADALQINNG
jgi:hypothetical protein